MVLSLSLLDTWDSFSHDLLFRADGDSLFAKGTLGTSGIQMLLAYLIALRAVEGIGLKP